MSIFFLQNPNSDIHNFLSMCFLEKPYEIKYFFNNKSLSFTDVKESHLGIVCQRIKMPSMM